MYNRCGYPGRRNHGSYSAKRTTLPNNESSMQANERDNSAWQFLTSFKHFGIRLFFEHWTRRWRTTQGKLWSGATWGQTHCPKFRLVINNPEGLRRLFVNPSELGIGEAYIAGDFDVEGDMATAFEIGD